MFAIKSIITGFISDDQPGFVACKFYDAWGKEHVIHEKIPVVATEHVDRDSAYPKTGVIGCEIIKRWTDERGRTILTVRTDVPWAIEANDGLTKFDLLSEQIVEI
jgi:uncharacterized protein YodC (DUF2158 family)